MGLANQRSSSSRKSPHRALGRAFKMTRAQAQERYNHLSTLYYVRTREEALALTDVTADIYMAVKDSPCIDSMQKHITDLAVNNGLDLYQQRQVEKVICMSVLKTIIDGDN